MLDLPPAHDAAIQCLLEQYPLALVALTRGAAGSLKVARTETVSHPGYTVEVVDTVGAGDAFTAALTVGLLAKRDLSTVNAGANRLAAFACSQPGATPPLPESLVASLRR